MSKSTNMQTPIYNKEQIVKVTYTNWRGVKEERTIVPLGPLQFTQTPWHPQPQWCVLVWCCDRKDERIFVMKDISNWRPAHE